jgi:hypothetical protein
MTHITIERAKLEQWLEKLQDVSEKVDYYGNDLMVGDEINAIKAALAQGETSSSGAAQQEPVLGVVIREGLPTLLQERDIKPTDTRLYTTPPQRTWVGLTDEEIQAVAKQARSKDHAVTLTNKLLKEKNT